MPYKRNSYKFLAFLKKVIQRNGKKFNFCVSRTTLCTHKKICMQDFVLENVFFVYKTRFAAERKNKKKILLSQSKKLVIQFQYMEFT